MSIQTRVHAGVPAGGQFDSHDRSESTTTLVAGPGPYFREAQRALAEVENTLGEAQRTLAARSIKDKLLDMHPGAAKAHFRAVDDGRTSLVSVENADGRAVPPRNGLGASIAPELNILGGRAVGYIAGAGRFNAATGELRFTADLTDSDLELRRQEWSAIAAVLPDEHVSIVAIEAIRVETRALFPTAAAVSVLDDSDGLGVIPQHVVDRISDAQGNVLWSQWGPGRTVVTHLNRWAALFDRNGDPLRVKTIAI